MKTNTSPRFFARNDKNYWLLCLSFLATFQCSYKSEAVVGSQYGEISKTLLEPVDQIGRILPNNNSIKGKLKFDDFQYQWEVEAPSQRKAEIQSLLK